MVRTFAMLFSASMLCACGGSLGNTDQDTSEHDTLPDESIDTSTDNLADPVDDSHADLTTTVFAVGGMTCGGCEASVKMVVKKLDGVEKVTASNKEGRATVTYDPAKVTTDNIVAAIEKIGYTAEVKG